MTCGQLVNGAIDAPAEQDVFTFAAEAGDIVTITLAQTAAVDPAFAAFGHLFGPTGAGPTPIGRGIVNVPITQTGTHTLRIFDLFNTSRGGYSVRAHWLFPLAKQCGDRVTLSCGQLSAGAINTPLEQDVFRFAAEAGDIVTITLAQTAAVDPAFVAFGHLFGPTGVGPTPIGRGIVNVPISSDRHAHAADFRICSTRREAATRSASTGCSHSRSNAATGSRSACWPTECRRDRHTPRAGCLHVRRGSG